MEELKIQLAKKDKLISTNHKNGKIKWWDQ